MALSDETFKEDVGLTIHGKTTSFRVWAPNAKAVSIIGDFNDWQETPLTDEKDGYWHVALEKIEPGLTYKYVIHTPSDEILYRNDPRGLQITRSKDGVSVIPDIEAEDWDKDSYVAPPKEQIIIYELHIGTFNRVDKATPGTFKEAIEKLDYLKALGITTIELMPIAGMSEGFGWGYEPNYIYSVEENYGGRRGLMDFVKACHERDIGVIVDIVYNHFDGDYLWQFDGWSENNGGGIYFYNDDRADTPWGGKRPDYGRPEVRQYILDNVKMWLVDYHIDGLRLDSTIYMRNRNGYNNDPAGDLPDAWSLLGCITELAHDINKNALVIAEDTCNEYLTKPVSDGGCGFDAQWGLQLPHMLRNALELSPGSLGALTDNLFSRFNGDPWQKIIFADSHDTASNGGERIVDETEQSTGRKNTIAEQKKSILVSAVALSSPGIPMLLQGQEFMQGGNFNTWKMLDWKRADKFSGIVTANQHLINLRLNIYGNTPGLIDPDIEIFHKNDDNHVLGYSRKSNDGDTLVIVNFSNSYIANYRVVLPSSGTWIIRFNSSWKGYGKSFTETNVAEVTTNADNSVELDLRGYMVLILSKG